jgi:hypothetical protein
VFPTLNKKKKKKTIAKIKRQSPAARTHSQNTRIIHTDPTKTQTLSPHRRQQPNQPQSSIHRRIRSLPIDQKKTITGKPKVLFKMIIICQNLRNNLQHPNEYILGIILC